MVRETGLEPVRVAPHAPQTCASADSATLAYFIQLYLLLPSALRVEQTRMRGTACGSQNFQRLGAPQNFDRYAIPSSLDPPPAALRSECCRFRHSRIFYSIVLAFTVCFKGRADAHARHRLRFPKFSAAWSAAKF